MQIPGDERLLIYKTFNVIVHNPRHMDKFSDLLYQNLFLLSPETEALFRVSMEDQSRKWHTMLVKIIVAIDRFATMGDELFVLGKRHVTYGVTPEDYEIMGKALVVTLEQFLGKDFTPNIGNAWLRMYNLVMDTMLASASDGRPEQRL